MSEENEVLIKSTNWTKEQRDRLTPDQQAHEKSHEHGPQEPQPMSQEENTEKKGRESLETS